MKTHSRKMFSLFDMTMLSINKVNDFMVVTLLKAIMQIMQYKRISSLKTISYFTSQHSRNLKIRIQFEQFIRT